MCHGGSTVATGRTLGARLSSSRAAAMSAGDGQGIHAVNMNVHAMQSPPGMLGLGLGAALADPNGAGAAVDLDQAGT